MSPEQRIRVMRERLEKAFVLTHLEIVDDSHLHVGHAGASGGAGHYTLLLAAPELRQLNRVDAHRAIYSVLKDLIPHELHAVQIKFIQEKHSH